MNYDQLKSMTDIKKEFFPAFFAIIRGITKQSNIVKDLNHTMDMQFNTQNKKESFDSKKTTSNPSRNLSNISADAIPSNDSYNEENENEYSTTFNTEYFYQHIASLQNDVENQTSNEVTDNLFNLTLPKENVILPCYTMLRTGKCIKGTSCTYNHTKENLLKAWQDMFAELKASPFNPNKHLYPGNTKSSYNSPQQNIVEDISIPDQS